MAKIKRYENLNELIVQESRAGQYYNSLPDYIRDMIGQRGNNIHTEKDLNRYAENLLAGDK